MVQTTLHAVKPSQSSVSKGINTQGWNDVSFHGSPQIPTPNLDALASSGIMLNNYYSECLCTPSRGSLLTGQYPIRLGLQHYVLRANEPSALPLEMNTMPQYFKDLGYATHMIGKRTPEMAPYFPSSCCYKCHLSDDVRLRQRARLMLSDADLSTIQVTVCFGLVPPQF
ncbi:arylsulfatase B [Trichonephila clavipes]|nr:arylsulfatase B [Trichonephila clavipes]